MMGEGHKPSLIANRLNLIYNYAEVNLMENKMDEIKKSFAERIHVDKVDETKTMKELGLDSLDVVEMCLDLEDKYGIQFETDELSSIKTVADLFDSIQSKLANKK
jgi:acyl carrier protein